MAEPEDKGYTVKDRRYFSQSEEEKDRMREEYQREAAANSTGCSAKESPERSKNVPPPEITFPSFLMSLSSSAFMHLGDLPDPGSGNINKDICMAKQTIDLLGMLREKTRNNLSNDEENLFDHILYDLRMRYVKEVSGSSSS
jgi:hypothetical protein